MDCRIRFDARFRNPLHVISIVIPPMKIMAHSCLTGPESSPWQRNLLYQLYTKSTPRLHEWTEDPEEADIIFLTGTERKGVSTLRQDPFPRRYPEKSFVLSEQDEAPFLMAGIYPSAPRELFGRGRFRSGSYGLHQLDFRNPLIENYDYGKKDSNPPPDLLASFLGRNSHALRRQLFRLKFPSGKILIEDTSHFNAFTHDLEGKREGWNRYLAVSLRSKFMLCPRGTGPASIRLFEALKLGVAPVVIADDWLPCEGPDWDKFTVFVREDETEALETILEKAESTFLQRGELARRAYDEYFSPTAYFNYLVTAVRSIKKTRVIPERCFVLAWPAGRVLRSVRQKISGWPLRRIANGAKRRARRLVGAS